MTSLTMTAIRILLYRHSFAITIILTRFQFYPVSKKDKSHIDIDIAKFLLEHTPKKQKCGSATPTPKKKGKEGKEEKPLSLLHLAIRRHSWELATYLHSTGEPLVTGEDETVNPLFDLISALPRSSLCRELYFSILTSPQERSTVQRLFEQPNKNGYTPFLILLKSCSNIIVPPIPGGLRLAYVLLNSLCTDLLQSRHYYSSKTNS